MARHHRNLDDWEAERGMTMGHSSSASGSLATGKTVIAKAVPHPATPRRHRQKRRPPVQNPRSGSLIFAKADGDE